MTDDEKKKSGLLGRVLTVFNKKREEDTELDDEEIEALAPEDEKERVEYFIELNRKRLKAEKDKLFK